MKIQLLIASDDDDYREQLSQVLTERYSDTFEVSVCSSAPRLAEQLSRRVFDAALLEPELAEHVQLSQVRMPLLLWNGSAGCAVSEHVRQIRKYQRISSMVSQLLEQYAAVAEKSGDAELERGRITVVWSPSGGCGKTTAALAYAAQRAGEGKKSLYLDLEAFSSGPVYFSQNGKSISSVFEKLDENVELLLQSIRQKDAVSGIFYFSQPENYDDISILTQEDVRLLVNASVQGIDELVIDLSSTFDDKIQMLLELADRILLVTDSSRASQQKLEQFRTQHSIYEKVREKTIQVANKGFRIHSEEGEHIPITARMLMSHTSSLEDGTVYSIPPEYSIQEFFVPEGKYWLGGEHFANSNDGVDRSPGVYFHYCNLNYGVLGTVIECITGQRFDEYMKENVLEPMGIGASYNPGDFDAEEIQKLSAIYQKQSGGVWDKAGPYIPQIDDYQGQVQDHDKVLITNPDLQDEVVLKDLSDYQIGTNGTIFSPQGGLRISMDEMKALIELFLNDGVVNGRQILTAESVDEMFTPVWTYDEAANNGNTYSGLMCSYGLGVQTMTSQYGDRFVEDRNIVLSGHFGEAYGLLAGLFLDRESGTVIYYVMNGMGGPEAENGGTYSSMYRWEEKFCTALLDNLFPEL